MQRFLFSLVMMFSCCALPLTVNAQQLDATHQDWRVYTINQQGKKVCYMASSPKNQAGTYKKRGEPYLLVTNVGQGKSEVSVSSGYPYKEGAEVSVAVDKTSFKLFTKGDLAWAYDGAQDNKMIAAMKKGNGVTVKGQSRLDSSSEDTYSLKGFTKAYQHIVKLCK